MAKARSGELLPPVSSEVKGELQQIAESLSANMTEISNEGNQAAADALGDFRGEIDRDLEIVMKETYFESGALESRTLVSKQNHRVVRE